MVIVNVLVILNCNDYGNYCDEYVIYHVVIDFDCMLVDIYLIGVLHLHWFVMRSFFVLLTLSALLILILVVYMILDFVIVILLLL